jgi:hypothetical protein
MQQPQQQLDNKSMEIAAGGGNYSARLTIYIPDKVSKPDSEVNELPSS